MQLRIHGASNHKQVSVPMASVSSWPPASRCRRDLHFADADMYFALCTSARGDWCEEFDPGASLDAEEKASKEGV